MCKSEIKVILLGNKSDLEKEREVSQEEGRNLAIENNYLFSEVSCKENSNILESFEKLIDITDKTNMRKFNDSFSLRRGVTKKKRKIYC